MSCKNHLINTSGFNWNPLVSGLDGLFDGGRYTGLTKVKSEYLHHDIEFYTECNRNMDDAMCSLEDYAISLGLKVYLVESGNATTTQQWYRFIIK